VALSSIAIGLSCRARLRYPVSPGRRLIVPEQLDLGTGGQQVCKFLMGHWSTWVTRAGFDSTAGAIWLDLPRFRRHLRYPASPGTS
jgi:hypothetical protein